MVVNTPGDWLRALVGLLPRGAAWNTDADSILSKLLSAYATGLARFEARAAKLHDEADPSTTLEMLKDWEDWLGLPSPCMALESQTLTQRRSAIVDKLTDVGGQRPQDYIDLAARLGVVITISEYDVHHTVMSGVNAPLCGFGFRFVWYVNMPANSTSIRYFSVMSPISEPLANWGNRLVECVIRARKPADTYVYFIYP